jgi:hypothetical protein
MPHINNLHFLHPQMLDVIFDGYSEDEVNKAVVGAKNLL